MEIETETKTEIKIETDKIIGDKVDKVDKVDKLENIFSNLNINKEDIHKNENKNIIELDYSNILYYSLVFDNDVYDKIVSLIFDNTNISGIYKFVSNNDIDVIKEKINTNQNDYKKDFLNIISKLLPNDIFAVKYNNNIEGLEQKQNHTLYKLNDKFHTTMLYLGGKKDVRAIELENFVNKEISIKIMSIGMSDKFIVCGIEFENNKIPYYGNPIQHITIGIKKLESDKLKLLPKDSPTAFDDGIKILLNEPIEIKGKIVKECKQIKQLKQNKLNKN